MAWIRLHVAAVDRASKKEREIVAHVNTRQIVTVFHEPGETQAHVALSTGKSLYPRESVSCIAQMIKATEQS